MSAGSSQRETGRPTGTNSDVPVRAARRRRRHVNDGYAGAKQGDIDNERLRIGRQLTRRQALTTRRWDANERTMGAEARRGPMTRPSTCEG